MSTRQDHGTYKVREAVFCNYCSEEVKNLNSKRVFGKPSSDAPAWGAEKSPKYYKLSGAARALADRTEGIQLIIARMWVWIGFQSLLIGIATGNAFPEIDSLNGDSRFSFSMFLIGVFLGVGTFAPIVFVVEALKEVVVNLAKGPISKSDLEKIESTPLVCANDQESDFLK